MPHYYYDESGKLVCKTEDTAARDVDVRVLAFVLAFDEWVRAQAIYPDRWGRYLDSWDKMIEARERLCEVLDE